MPTFGGYQTVAELYRGGLGSLWSARSASGSVVAVKTCQPDPEIVGEAAARQVIESFIAQAELQRRVAAAGGEHWAPVHAIGRIDAGAGPGVGGGAGGAYAVTDLYSRSSVERWLASGVPADARMIGEIVRGVVQGLRELHGAAGRPHGNLRATNILLHGEGDVVSGAVRLSDPLIGPPFDAGLAEVADRRAIGDLIRRLVTRRGAGERGAGGGWPVADGPEWARIGRSGPALLNLCNQLLDPGLAAGSVSLDQIEQAVAPPPPAKARRWVWPAIGAAAVVAIAAVLAVLLRDPKVEQTPEHQEQWQYLVAQYEGWIGPFVEALERPPSAPPAASAYASRRELFEKSDEHLRGALQALLPAGGGLELNPAEVVDKYATIDVIGRAYPVAGLKESHARKLTRAVGAIREFREALVPSAWEAARVLDEARDAWAERGWVAAAGAIPRGPGPSLDGTLAEVLEDVVQAHRVVRRINERWSKVEQSERVMAARASGDAVLERFPEWARQEATRAANGDGAGVLASLQVAVDRAAEIGAELERFVAGARWDRICVEQFSAGPLHAAVREGRRGVTDGVFNDWLALATSGAYDQPDAASDPRREWRLADVRRRLEGAAAGMDRLELSLEDPGQATLRRAEAAVGLDQPALASLEARCRRLMDRLDQVAGERWDCTTRQEVETLAASLAAAVTADLPSLAAALEQVVREEERDIGERLREVRSALLDGDSEAVKADWVRRRDRMLRDADSLPAADQRRRIRAAADVKARLKTLEREFPTPEVPAALRARYPRLADTAAARRESLLRDALEAVDDLGGPTTALDAAAESMRDWARQARELGGLATELESSFDAGFGLNEAVEGAPSPRQRLEAVRKHPLFGEAAAALESVTTRAEALEAIERESDVAALVRALDSGQTRPEARLAAWRRLVSTDWPATVEELVAAAGAAGRLRAEVDRLASGRSDGAALRQRINDELGVKWTRFVGGDRSLEELQRAFDPGMMESFGVTPEEARAIDPFAWYRWRLHRLEGDCRGAGADGAALARQFVNEVRSAGGLERVGAVGDLLRDLEPFTADVPAPPKAKPEELGPGKVAGYTGTSDPDHRRVVFTRTVGAAPVVLEFRLLEPENQGGGGGARPQGVFLQTTELSVGQFIGIVDAAGAWDRMSAVLRRMEDVPLQFPLDVGVMAWTPGGRGRPISVNRQWYHGSRPQVDGENPAFAAEWRSAGGDGKSIRAGFEATEQSPMQQVSPAAAMLAAALVNCRLPSPAEFLDAVARTEREHPGCYRNLRDASFRQQREYVLAMRQRLPGGADQFILPETGAFAAGGAGGPDDGSLATEVSDGYLFFAPVGTVPAGSSATPFLHLVGNVAEYVRDLGDDQGLIPPDLPGPSVLQLTRGTARSRVKVVGGSALSPPGVPPARLLDLPPPPALANPERGWADVGFRLAFSAEGVGPAKSIAMQIAEMITPERYRR